MANIERELYRSDDEVEEVFRRFESCEFRPGDFKHPQHLTVALCLVLRHEEPEALARMRHGLLRFIEANGINPSPYNETVTLYWLKRVRAFVERAGTSRRLRELANELLKECAD